MNIVRTGVVNIVNKADISLAVCKIFNQSKTALRGKWFYVVLAKLLAVPVCTDVSMRIHL